MKRRGIEPRNKRRRGIALIITLWVIMVVSTIALTYSFEARIQTQITGYRADSLRAYYLAKAGMHRAMVLILEDLLKDQDILDKSAFIKLDKDDVGIQYDALTEEWFWGPEDSSDREGSYENHLFEAQIGNWRGVYGKYSVEVVDEASKLNINVGKVKQEVLRALIMATGVNDEEKADVIAAAIVDYRDPDDDPTDAGDERFFGEADSEDTYWNPAQDPDDIREGDGPEFLCKNGPFGSVDEVLLVLEHLEKPLEEGGLGLLEEGEGRLIFFGEDANRNGKLDPNEEDGNDSYPPDNGDNDLWLGLRNYLTVDSKGTVNINTATYPVLAAVLSTQIDEKEAPDKAEKIVQKRDGRETERRRRLKDPWRTWEDIDIDGEVVEALKSSGLVSLDTDAFTIISTGEYPARDENRYVPENRKVQGVRRTLRATVVREFREETEIEKERENRLQRELAEERGVVSDPRDDDQARIFVKRFTEEI